MGRLGTEPEMRHTQHGQPVTTLSLATDRKWKDGSLRHSLAANLIRHKGPPTKIITVTRHQGLDTLLAYACEVAREEDPTEVYVSCEAR